MQEKILEVMRSLLQMIDHDFNNNDIKKQNTLAIYSFIKQQIDKGTKVTRTVGDCTALMVYAMCNVTDNRLTDLLNKDGAYLNQPACKYDDWSVKTPLLSALTLSAAFGATDALKLLVQTGKYNKHHIGYAVNAAAATGAANSISTFHELGANLFYSVKLQEFRPLFIACLSGHPDVVRAILATNPREEDINIASDYDIGHRKLTAYEIAVQYRHHECAALLAETRGALWVKAVKLLEDNNITELLTFIKKHPSKYLMQGPDCSRSITLLGKSAIMATKNNQYRNTYLTLKKYLMSFVPEFQINCLLLSLSSIINEAENDNNFESTSDNRYYQDILKTLKSLHENYQHMSTLIIDSASLNEELWQVITNILDHKNIVNIDLAVHYPTCNFKTYGEEYRLFKLLVENIKFQSHCGIRVSGKGKINFLHLLIERNEKMSQNPLEYRRDLIYNSYIKEINERLLSLKEDQLETINEPLLQIKPISLKAYPLIELTAFFLMNKHANFDLEQAKLSIATDLHSYLECAKLPEKDTSPSESNSFAS